MSLRFVQLKLGAKTYADEVSTDGCDDVDDFRHAIRRTFLKLLHMYDSYQLILVDSDDMKEIDPQTAIEDLTNKPLVVVVRELPFPAKRQPHCRVMSAGESCRTYLNALARKISLNYDFPKMGRAASITDVLDARHRSTWNFKLKNGLPLSNIPLPDLLSNEKWDVLKRLDRFVSRTTLYDCRLARTTSCKPFIIIPHSDFIKTGYVDGLKTIAAVFGLIESKGELIVMDELDCYDCYF
jgi:hypothetical protein